MISSLLATIGHHLLDLCEQAGDFAVLSGRAFAKVFKRPFDGANLLYQLH